MTTAMSRTSSGTLSRRASFSFTHEEVEEQTRIVEEERRKRHDEWIQSHNAAGKFTHKDSLVRAQLLVTEARRLELAHLNHQLAYCQKLVRQQDSDVNSPPRIRCESDVVADCPCLRAPVFRQLTAKFRAMNVLLPHFRGCDLESTVDTIQRTYKNDNEMMEDLLYRYGPEPSVVDPHLWLRSIEERLDGLDAKWKEIAECVSDDMRLRDNFQSVIRNFSVMRIFLEGAQAPTYSCDSSDRVRRDNVHRSVLEELETTGRLFLEKLSI
eukprot:GILI01010837.1.p1 GENE.GILI01010837.1~~GILI01010837.1.p1  ORF type:complete len:268 (+),score=56.59 GILI01010837.1:54-857(+)